MKYLLDNPKVRAMELVAKLLAFSNNVRVKIKKKSRNKIKKKEK